MRCKPEQIYRRMRYLVERDELYLDPHLSLTKLSTLAGTNTLYLSRAINVCYGHNFKTMLNDMRIDYAKKLLKSKMKPQFRLKDFHLECGFLSKSAFYTAFRQRIDTTPKAYMYECMEQEIMPSLDNEENKGEAKNKISIAAPNNNISTASAI